MFARYLRKVHVEWCPFKPKALAPIFLQEIHTSKVQSTFPKLAVSKALLPAPRGTTASPSYLDRTRITFADGSEKLFDFTDLKLNDLIEELEMENTRIQRDERDRGRPFS